MAQLATAYLPTLEEIKALCLQIQEEWTLEERLRRGRVKLDTFMVSLGQ